MKHERSIAPRPDTSKNGMLKKHQLQVRDESVRARGRDILSRLGKGSRALRGMRDVAEKDEP